MGMGIQRSDPHPHPHGTHTHDPRGYVIPMQLPTANQTKSSSSDIIIAACVPRASKRSTMVEILLVRLCNLWSMKASSAKVAFAGVSNGAGDVTLDGSVASGVVFGVGGFICSVGVISSVRVILKMFRATSSTDASCSNVKYITMLECLSYISTSLI